MAAAEERLAQLKQAEALVLQDPSHYQAILPAVVALTTQTDYPLRRWIATFLTNTFASKVLDGQVKEDLASIVVDGLRRLAEEDVHSGVLKSCILCSSLVYPLLFRRVYRPLIPSLLGIGTEILLDAKIQRKLYYGGN
jgi:symplekin